MPGDDPGSMILTTAVGILDTPGDQARECREVRRVPAVAGGAGVLRRGDVRVPARGGVEPAVDLPPLDQLEAPAVDLSDLGGGLERTRELIRESGLEGS